MLESKDKLLFSLAGGGPLQKSKIIQTCHLQITRIFLCVCAFCSSVSFHYQSVEHQESTRDKKIRIYHSTLMGNWIQDNYLTTNMNMFRLAFMSIKWQIYTFPKQGGDSPPGRYWCHNVKANRCSVVTQNNTWHFRTDHCGWALAVKKASCVRQEAQSGRLKQFKGYGLKWLVLEWF